MSEFIQVLSIICVFLGFLFVIVTFFYYNPEKFKVGYKKRENLGKGINEVTLTVDAKKHIKKKPNGCKR